MFTKFRTTIYLLLNLFNVFLPKNTIIILSYHSISDNEWQYGVTLENFKKHIEYLEKHYQFITLDDVYDFLVGKKNIVRASVVITFDDGYKDNITIKDYVKKKNLKPALFVLSAPNNANRKEMDNRLEVMSKHEILSLYKDGWIIGSHTATHADLRKCNNKQLEKEVITSKKTLEKELGIQIDYFAYPKGFYSDNAIVYTKKAGYKLALTVDDEILSEPTNHYLVPRISVDRTHTFTEFKYMITPAAILFRKFLKRSKLGRLIG